jgi:hypothetical protein
MWIEQDLSGYNASINLRSESSEREKRCGPNQKKIRKFKTISKFALRILSAYFRIAIDAGNFDVHGLIVCTASHVKVIAYSFLLERAEKEI